MKLIILIFLIFISSFCPAQIITPDGSGNIPDIKYFHATADSSNGLINSGYSIKSHSVSNILFQIIATPVITFAAMMPPVFASAGLNLNKDQVFTSVASMVFLYSCYTFSVSLSVHLIAGIENKNNSLTKTFIYGAMGGGAGILFSTAMYSTNKDWWVGIIIGPLLGTLAYTNIFAEWPKETIASEKYENRFSIYSKLKIFSHKDYIESTKLFKMDMIRIKFLTVLMRYRISEIKLLELKNIRS